MPKTYSTTRAAKIIGVHPLTLHRWIKSGLISPGGFPIEGRTIWRWSDDDIAEARKLKGTLKPGPKPASKRKGAKK
jgi:predicted site-specific integrase-resolvase